MRAGPTLRSIGSGASVTDRRQEAGASASSAERLDLWAPDPARESRGLRPDGEDEWGPSWRCPHPGLEERLQSYLQLSSSL